MGYSSEIGKETDKCDVWDCEVMGDEEINQADPKGEALGAIKGFEREV